MLLQFRMTMWGKQILFLLNSNVNTCNLQKYKNDQALTFWVKLISLSSFDLVTIIGDRVLMSNIK